MKKAHFLLSVTGVFSFLLLPFSLVAEMNFKSSFDWKSGNVKSIGKEIKFVQCEFTSPRLIKCAAVRIDRLNFEAAAMRCLQQPLLLSRLKFLPDTAA